MKPLETKTPRSKWTVVALSGAVLAVAALVGTVDWRETAAPIADPESVSQAPEIDRNTTGAVIQQIVAPVQIGRPESDAWRDAKGGDRLEPGETVRTGWGGRAEIALSGNSIRLFENSAFRLPSEDRSTRVRAVNLDLGSALFDVERRPGERHFEVHTPEAVAAVRGTRFGVTTEDAQVELVVFEGSVAIWSEEQPEVLVRPGFGASGTGEAPFQISVMDATDPWATWTQPTVTMPRIDLGETLHETAADALKDELSTIQWPSPSVASNEKPRPHADPEVRKPKVRKSEARKPKARKSEDRKPEARKRLGSSDRSPRDPWTHPASTRDAHREADSSDRSDFDDSPANFDDDRDRFDDDKGFADDGGGFDDDAEFDDGGGELGDDDDGFSDDGAGKNFGDDDGFDEDGDAKSKKSRKSKR